MDQPLPRAADHDRVKHLERQNAYLAEKVAEMVGLSQTDMPAIYAEKVSEIYTARLLERIVRRQLDAEDRQRMVLLSAAEMRARPAPEWMIEGMLPATGIGTLFGQSGVYKSFVALHLMLCLGAGVPFLGRPVNCVPGRSVYVMGEGQYDAGQRLDAALAAHPRFASAADCVSYVEQAFPLSDGVAVAELTGLAKNLGDVRLVVFDSLADFYGADDSESNSTDMQRIVRGMRQLSEALGCVVIANAHSGHDQADEDGSARPRDRMRGSSRFRQAWDFEWMADGQRIRCTKNRYGEMFAPVPYAVERSGASLAVREGTHGAASAEPEWPHPVTEDQLDRVLAAVRATPGQSGTVIARAAGVRKDVAFLALAKAAEAGLIVNTGNSDRPKWREPEALTQWLSHLRAS